MVERSTVNRLVIGSNPIWGEIKNSNRFGSFSYPTGGYVSFGFVDLASTRLDSCRFKTFTCSLLRSTFKIKGIAFRKNIIKYSFTNMSRFFIDFYFVYFKIRNLYINEL